MHDTAVIDTVRRHAVPVDLESAAQRLLEAIDPDVSLVLIGEATHGTLEFYRIRADLTRALIRQRGFNVVAVEADWPDAYRANQWVRLFGTDSTAEEALADFTRFPRWMWRNREVVRFLRWLRSENAERRPDARAGFYGLDLYSLHRSMARVIEYLDKVDPQCREEGSSRLRLLRCLRRGRAAVRLHRQSEHRTLVRRRGRGAARRSATAGGRVREARRTHRRRRVLRRRTERAGRPRRGNLLPRDVPRRRGILERPRPAHDDDSGRSARPC